MDINEVTQISDELVSAFEHLIPQLSSSNPPPTEAELTEIIASPASVLFIAKDPSQNGKIVGTLTLVLFRIPTGIRAWIEDVVVDSTCRRKGIGEALNREAIQRAIKEDARTIDLTSRPSREAANRLYRRLGFTERETNVYRYKVESRKGKSTNTC